VPKHEGALRRGRKHLANVVSLVICDRILPGAQIQKEMALCHFFLYFVGWQVWIRTELLRHWSEQKSVALGEQLFDVS